MGVPPAVALTSRCMLFTWVGLMDKASSYHRRASSMFPRSSATWPRMYRTLWDIGKRLAASWVQAVASAGFPMPMYTSAVGKRAEADAFLVHCPSEALRTAVTLVGDITFPPRESGRGPFGICRNQSQPGPHPEWKQLQTDSPSHPLLRRDLSHSYCEARKGTNVTTTEGGVRPAWGPPRDIRPQGPPRIP